MALEAGGRYRCDLGRRALRRGLQCCEGRPEGTETVVRAGTWGSASNQEGLNSEGIRA